MQGLPGLRNKVELVALPQCMRRRTVCYRGAFLVKPPPLRYAAGGLVEAAKARNPIKQRIRALTCIT